MPWQVREYMAWFPDANFGLHIGPHYPASTALDFFQKPRTLDRRPSHRPDFNREYFSSQDGKQQYSIAHRTAASSVRWG